MIDDKITSPFHGQIPTVSAVGGYVAFACLIVIGSYLTGLMGADIGSVLFTPIFGAAVAFLVGRITYLIVAVGAPWRTILDNYIGTVLLGTIVAFAPEPLGIRLFYVAWFVGSTTCITLAAILIAGHVRPTVTQRKS